MHQQLQNESQVYLDQNFHVAPSSKAKLVRVRRSSWLIRLALIGVVVNVIIVTVFSAFFAVSLAELHAEQRRGPVVSHLTIDTNRVHICPADPVSPNQLPCLKRNGGYMTAHGEALGPWTCLDAAPGHCPASPGSKEVIIPEHGVYAIVAQTVVTDALASEVTLQLRVNNKIRRACVVNSNTSWISCSVGMLEGLRAGDRLTVGLPQDYRLISPHRTVTYLDLARIGGSAERRGH